MNTLALLFPGQGSQYAGMGAAWYRDHASVRDTFQEAESALGMPLGELCFQGDMHGLAPTEIAQPAILTVSVAAFRLLRSEFGLEPAWLAGHSLGEISALACSGALDFSAAIRLVRRRGLLMKEAGKSGEGAMAAVENSAAGVITRVCDAIVASGGSVWISNFNARDQHVISGLAGSVALACERLRALGSECIPLRVSGAFHSPLMVPVAEAFRAQIESCLFRAPRWPVVSSVTGLPYPGPEEMGSMLGLQLVRPVLWQAALDFLIASGCRRAVEAGPGKVLRNLGRRAGAACEFLSFDASQDAGHFPRAIPARTETVPGGIFPGAKLDSAKFLRLCLGAAASTRNRNWEERGYREGVQIPVKRLVEMELDGSVAKAPRTEAIEEATVLLERIFSAKGVPETERNQRLLAIRTAAGIPDPGA